MPKLEFTEAYWNQATSIFEGVQVIESKKLEGQLSIMSFLQKKECLSLPCTMTRKRF